jgi:hypothetical protein
VSNFNRDKDGLDVVKKAPRKCLSVLPTKRRLKDERNMWSLKERINCVFVVFLLLAG